MEDEVFMQEILHNSNRQSSKPVIHKDVVSIQKNIWKLCIGINLQHSCRKLKMYTTRFPFKKE